MMFGFPDGWKLQSVEDSMKAIIDYRGKTPRKTPSGVPLITAKIVKDGRIMTPTDEALERLLVERNSYSDKLPKTEVARDIAPHMEPNRNRSKSFQVFLEGLKACVGEESLV